MFSGNGNVWTIPYAHILMKRRYSYAGTEIEKRGAAAL